jgi:oligopeptidase B
MASGMGAILLLFTYLDHHSINTAMKKRNLCIYVCLFLLTACNQSRNKLVKKEYQWPRQVAAPVCEKQPKALTAHGDTRMDDYYWLNGYFYKTADSDRVVKYLKAENDYLDTMMAETRGLRTTLYDEMKGRIKEKDESVPVYKNGYYYYIRYVEGKDYYVYCRRKGSMEADEEVLLDVNEMAKGHGYYSVTGFSVSPDNRRLAFGVDTLSRRQYTLHVKDLATNTILEDNVTGTEGYAVWANDNQTFFYVSKNPVTLLSEKIQKHILGQPAANDAVVYEEKDKSNYIDVRRSLSGKYIFINSAATLSSEVRYISADMPQATFRVFQPRMKDVLYSVSHQNGRFLIVTNQNALNFKLMTCALDATTQDHWKEYITHRTDVLLEDVAAFRNHLVISERKEGLLQVRIIKLSDNSEHYLAFEEPAYLAYVAGNADYDTKTLRFNYTSLTTPNSVYDYDMDSREKKLRKQTEVVGGYDKSNYMTERIYATSKDGVRIPVSLVYKKGLEKNGQAPCLLYGYGAYGNSIDAMFSSNMLSLLNRGFVYAIAHIRGGQEMGRQWYEDGKMLKKINTFNDFIACGEFLIAQGFTSKEHLYASGGSAGGLLVGAVVNMRPDLWKGVVAEVPFVDVITTMSDPNIPLTTNEYDEWGNPANKVNYDYMKTYSPYDNVGAKIYPNMLVTTGLYDSQVQYFEPAKWVAKLRTVKKGDNLLLLKTNMEAGHSGASGRFKYLEDEALQYAFFLALEGIGE